MSTKISKPSHRSLLLTALSGGIPIGIATGFVAQLPNGRPYLVTNRHVVTGRDNETNKCLNESLALPDALRISHNAAVGLGHYVDETVPLYDGGATADDGVSQSWFEHPNRGPTADVIALPIEKTAATALYPYEVRALTERLIEPGSVVRIVGFPFGEKTGASFAVWSTGFVATEPEMNHGDWPIFLVDCRARRGQSGSPVIVYTGGHGPLLHPDERQINVGDIHLLGVYSGRISEESDLGNVWKSWLIAEILTAAEIARAGNQLRSSP